MIVGHVSLYRTCTKIDVVYICTYICTWVCNQFVQSTYVHVYVHGCVISLYILYSTLLYCVNLNDSAVNSGGFSHGSKGSMEPPFLPDNLSIKQAHGTVILEKYSDQLLQRTLNFHERV